MAEEACKFVTGVVFILRKEGKILLFKRNIPGKIAFGSYVLPGGTVEHNETIKQTVCREAAEEIGVEIKEQDVSIVHVVRLREKYDAVTGETKQILILYFTEIKKWIGEPRNVEPHKHSDLEWFDISMLPKELFPLNKQALHHINKGTFYSEHGW